VKVGDPFEADTGMGPLTMQRQLDRVLGYIEKGKNEGAKLALGGGVRPGSIAVSSSSRPCSRRRADDDDLQGRDFRPGRFVHRL
jgi:hypothetical protein